MQFVAENNFLWQNIIFGLFRLHIQLSQSNAGEELLPRKDRDLDCRLRTVALDYGNRSAVEYLGPTGIQPQHKFNGLKI